MRFPIVDIPPKDKGWAYYAKEQERYLREMIGDRLFESLNRAIERENHSNARQNQMEGR